ncbi:MAG TPA: hypothetical protein VLU25_04975 [Acidobacteriota bacterium]|nr:hypothetical protein [Acidobacteriota bacterium]
MKATNRLILLLVLVLTGGMAFLVGAFFQPGEYEIDSIDSRTWVVTARGESGETLSFRMPPSVFKGRCFRANLTGVEEGERFSIVGPPGEKFDRLQVEAARGQKGEGKGAKAGRSRRPNTRGMQDYCITDVDSARLTVTAQSRSGERIRFKFDPASFRGYRFRVPGAAELAAGERFSLTTPNDVPVRCCTLEERSQ